MTKILVLYGGISKEKEVSIVTGEGIYQVLKSSKNMGDDITVEKYELTDDIMAFIEYINTNKEDLIVFNALHGKFGEDGRIQSILDLLEVPYTHSGVLPSAIAMNKIISKDIVKSLGVPVAHHQVISLNDIEYIEELELSINYPFVMKPIDEGSSVGIFLIHNKVDFQESLAKMGDFDKIMLEEYIKGMECTVGVINHKALTTTEITTDNAFYDYEAKYSEGGSKHITPANISVEMQKQMMKYAEEISQKFSMKGALRVDFICSDNTPYFLELNNQPGMTTTSLLPEQAQHLGISFEDLCLSLLALADYDN